MKNPSVFLSSTIFDFADLRSAVKYYLEQQGCVVFASEFNDFPKPLDEHSYDACLTTIQQADYFLLFVGSRVGGWYDENEKVSITRREYREAYKLHQQGKLKLIVFVRSEVWNYRESVNELEKYLNSIGKNAAEVQMIKNRPSKFAEDAGFICDFISEISKNEETKAAVVGKQRKPTGNWIHVFRSFGDVSDVLRSLVFSGIPIDQAVMRRLLLVELETILKAALTKSRSNVFDPHSAVDEFYRVNTITFELRPRETNTVLTNSWDRLSVFGLLASGIRFNTTVLSRALESSTFLAYDIPSGSLQETEVYRALFKLRNEIFLFDLAREKDSAKVFRDNAPVMRRSQATSISIDAVMLISGLHLIDRLTNIISLSRSLVQHLRSNTPFVYPILRPKSPVPAMNEDIELSEISDEELYAYISLSQ